MVKFKKSRHYDYPPDWAVPFLLDNEPDAMDFGMEDIEDVTQWVVVEEKNVGDERIGKKKWCAHSEIPKFAQHIFKPEFLTFFENSVWNRKTRIYSFEIEPMADYLKKRLKCGGRTIYKDMGGRMERDFEIKISINIPLFGHGLERFVIDKLARNEQSEHELTSKNLELGYKRLKKAE